MSSGSQFNQSTMSYGPDPSKISQLFDKIEKSNNLEIEERSLKNLSQKIQNKLVDISYIANNNAHQVETILGWIQKRQGQASVQSMGYAVAIIKAFTLKSEGKFVLLNIGATEFLDGFQRQLNEYPTLQIEVQDAIRNLIQDQPVTQSTIDRTQHQTIQRPGFQTLDTQNQTNVFGRNLESNPTIRQTMPGHTTLQSQALLNQLPVREDNYFSDEEQKSQMASASQFSQSTTKTMFSKKEFRTQVNPVVKQTQAIKVEQLQMEIKVKQQQLRETCELPFVQLSDEDEKYLFDLSVQLKFGDFKNILNATQKIQNLAFFDFPIEVFLQRTDILRALIDLIDGAHGSVYTNLAQPVLITFVQRLRTLYQYLGDSNNKISHMLQNERDAQVPLEPYLQQCYPCNHNGRWQAVQEIRDVNKYGLMPSGFTIKQQNMTAASLQNSLSALSALGTILTKSIYLMKDTEKIGIYIQLINETMETTDIVFRVRENDEFSNFIHLCLFALDSVCEYYKEAIFSEVLIKPILPLALRFLDYLNTIPQSTKKHQQPFSECLLVNTPNLQMVLRRTIFMNVYESLDHPSNQIIIQFFNRLETELPNVNLLQKGVMSSFERAKTANEKYLAVQAFKLNAQGLIKNSDSGIVFIETIAQYHQSLKVLDDLLQCIEMRMDFPYEHLLVDCILFGILAEESSMDPKLDQLESLFKLYLTIPIPEVRERVIRKVFQRIRLLQSLDQHKRQFNNNTLLSKFIYRKQVLSHFINGMLINEDIANEESKLQMTLGQIIVKILITAYNEGGFISQRSNLSQHFLTFHSLLKTYPDLIGMIDLIEENAQSKQIRLNRILRDLFNHDQKKREFATSILKQSLSRDSLEYQVTDLLKEVVDLKQPTIDVSMELDQINSNFDYSSFDTVNIQQILMSSTSDYTIKKQCLDQLVLVLFDFQTKKGRSFLKNQGQIQDMFTFAINELMKAHQSCVSYLKQQVSMLEMPHVQFLNECLRFVFLIYVLYFDEPEIKAFFDKFRLLTQPKDRQDQSAQLNENFLNATMFFMGSTLLKKNAIRLLQVIVFHQVLLQQKVIKQQQPNGQMKKAIQIYVPDFITKSFILVIPNYPQPVKLPVKDDQLLTDEQKMYIQSQLVRQDYAIKDHQELIQVARDFIVKVADKKEDYNKVMQTFEILQNHILSSQQLKDELVNSETITSLIETLKILPTRDFEFSFLSDYLIAINSILGSYQMYAKDVANLTMLVSKLCDGLKYHLIPYLVETGTSYIAEINQVDSEGFYSPKLHFMQRFLDIINTIIQVDLYLRTRFRVNSNFQDKLLNNNLVAYLADIFQLMKPAQSDNKRKILLIFFNVINHYETRKLNLEFLPEMLITHIATQKMSLTFKLNSLLMICLRSLIHIHDKRMMMIKGPTQNHDIETSVSLSQTSVQYLQKYQSFGWLVRLIESRDSRIRILAWDLICDLFDYEFLKQNPSIVQSALNTYLKHQELYSVKISVLKFLNHACDALIHNCDITREQLEQSEMSIDESNYLGSQAEQVSVKTLLQAITKQGLITQIHNIISQKDFPLIFLTLTMQLLHKLVLMDYRKALPVLTQLDYWTFLVDFINSELLKEFEKYENRLILQDMKQRILNDQNAVRTQDMVYLALNSILEFIFEAFKRDQQLANLLVKTTKLMPNLFEVWQTTVEIFKSQDLKLQNNGILLIFVDKLTKILHCALLHPRDYSIDLLKKFLFSSSTRYSKDHQPKNWVYFTELFAIVDKVSTFGSVYGVIEVRLAMCRFVSEFLLRLNSDEPNYLDEMIERYDAANLAKTHSRADLESFGSLILVQMGVVFKQLYVEKDLIQRASETNDPSEQENQKIDICMCISILLASCLSAKTASVEHNLIKKVIEICNEHSSALILQEIQVSTKKQIKAQNQNKSILGKSTLNNSMAVQSVFQSQMQRQFKYVNLEDSSYSEREILRMLQVLRHLFYNSKAILAPLMFEKRQKILQQSKLSNTNTSKITKPEQIIGDKFVSLVGTLIDDLGQSYDEIGQETLLTTITFASQCPRFKNSFTTSAPFQQSKKQTTLLKIVTDHIQKETMQTNSTKLKLLFQVLRSVSASQEGAKEIMKQKFIEESLAQIQPSCKSEKDIRMIKHYLNHYTGFLASYASSEEGQKIILKQKNLFEYVLFVLDTVTISGQGGESSIMSSIIGNLLLFLRNVSFTRTNKLHFLSNETFLPCLLSFLTNSNHTPKVKAYSVGCLWMILYNHQGVKAALNRSEVISELQLMRQEYQRQCDIQNYSYYVDSRHENQIIAQVDKQQVDALTTKRMNDFTLNALNGILKLLSQK